MKKNIVFILTLLMVFLVRVSFSQISDRSDPISSCLDEKDRKSIEINTYQLPYINNKKEVEKAKKDNYPTNPAIGVGIDVVVDLKKDATPLKLKDGTLYLYRFKSETAYSMRFLFEQFHIPEGAKLYLYNEDRSMKIGAFTNRNHRESGKFATQGIRGNSVIIEYFEPKESEFEGKLVLRKIVHRFKELSGTKGPGTSGACMVNVACAESGGFEQEVKSVVYIEYHNESQNKDFVGTGFLINKVGNYNFSDKPFLFTAAHCWSDHTNTTLEDYTFYFNYQTESCNGNASAVEPDETQSVDASCVLSCDKLEYSDYCLIELNTTVSELMAFDVAYAGWDRTPNQESNFSSTSIHHPDGDVKKISIDYDPPTAHFGINQLNTTTKCFWEVNFESDDIGSVEKGSSGAPLFNESKKVIGIVSHSNIPPNNCQCDGYLPNGKPIYFGRLDIAFMEESVKYGANIASYLDPNNSMYNYVNTWSPSSQPPPPPSDKFYQLFVDGFFINGIKESPLYICKDGVVNLKITPNVRFGNVYYDGFELKKKEREVQKCDKPDEYCDTFWALCLNSSNKGYVMEWWPYIVSLQESDRNWARIGPEYVETVVDMCAGSKRSHLDIKPEELFNIQLEEGKYYRFKLAQAYTEYNATTQQWENHWDHKSYLLYMSSESLELSGEIAPNDYYVKYNCTLNNAFSSGNVTIGASSTVLINSETNINGEFYAFIDEDITCYTSSENVDIEPEINIPSDRVIASDKLNSGAAGSNCGCKLRSLMDIENYKEVLSLENLLLDDSNLKDKYQLVISPNPNNGIFRIALNEKEYKDAKIELYNNLGKVIYSLNNIAKEVKVDLSSYSSGVYYLNIIIDGESITEKILYR